MTNVAVMMIATTMIAMGEMLSGIGGGEIMVNGADAVSLSSMPVAKAIALTVIFKATKIGLAYIVEADEGSELSRVYVIVAPGVLQLNVTLWGEEYVPEDGLNSGAETFSVTRLAM